MKQIKLTDMKLTNFKGIKSLEINFNGSDTKVYGANEVGKTTVFDSFVWLLFNEDSDGRTDFQIKRMENDEVIHHLDHEVEATLLVGNEKLSLKKVFKEKWTKPRGKVEQEFGGHTTDYYINEVPSKKKEYDDKIAEIIDKDSFRLLTNPSEFNKNIHWKKRREILFSIAGDVEDGEVIKSDKQLSKLLDVLNGNTIEDHKKVIASKRKEINKRLNEIPTRIDEINRNEPDLTGLNETEIKDKLKELNTQIDSKNEQINSIKNGAETNELKLKISDIDLQIAKVNNEHEQNEQNELYKLKAKLQEEQSNYQILQGDVRSLIQHRKGNKQLIESYKEQMKTLRKDFKEADREEKEITEQEFNHNEECTCPVCEQELQQEKIDEAIARFNENKANSLERIKERKQSINKKGTSLSREVENLNNENEELQKQIDKVTVTGTKKKVDVAELEEKIAQAEKEVKPIGQNEQYVQLTAEKLKLQEQIGKLELSVEESIKAVQDEIQALNSECTDLQGKLLEIESVAKTKKRIEELLTEEKQLAAAFEDLEHQLYLTEEFTRKKVEMVTDNINNKFEFARFKLFEEQINGGINETCVMIGKNGESYDNINTAHKLNSNLDVINTLSIHYGIRVPIFVDNAESVTSLVDLDTQIISLVVSENDEELRIECKDKTESVAV